MVTRTMNSANFFPGPIRATPKSRRLRTTLMMQINKSRFNCVSAERWARKELSGCSAHE